MSALTNGELMQEFYELHKEEYPDLTIEEFKEICYSPWRYMREGMENGEYPELRIKYFGVFQVHRGRATAMLSNLKERFSKQQVAAEEYFRYKGMLERFLNKDEKS